jgi:hypothetical protein
MKPGSLLVLLPLLAVATMASPLVERQNDVPVCVTPDYLPGEIFGSMYECEQACYGREMAEGVNEGGICKGECELDESTSAFGGFSLHCRR